MISLLAFLFSASVQAETISCRWEPDQRPVTFLVYDTETKVAETLSGWDDPACPERGRAQGLILDLPPEAVQHQCLRTYEGVTAALGFPPYGTQGVSLLGFGGDVLIAHVRLTFNGTLGAERSTFFPYESYWGDPRLPGDPNRDPVFYQKFPLRGVCWTGALAPRTFEN